MAKFLTTNGISFYIEEVIVGAKSEIFLVSPYLKLSTNLYERLKDADLKNIKINLIYGKDDLREDQWKLLTDLNNLNLFFKDNLHAKCYFNEDMMVISSMNMYEFSEKNNREMGVLIMKNEDEGLFKEGYGETSSIISSSKVMRCSESRLVNSQEHKENIENENVNCEKSVNIDMDLFERLRQLRYNISLEEGVPAYVVFDNKSLEHMAIEVPRNNDDFLKIVGVGKRKLEEYGSVFLKEINAYCREKYSKQSNGKNNSGFCIRCGTKIHYDLEKPFCKSCYSTWACFNNTDYSEEYCHKCGKHTDSSKNKPLCYSCFKCS